MEWSVAEVVTSNDRGTTTETLSVALTLDICWGFSQKRSTFPSGDQGVHVRDWLNHCWIAQAYAEGRFCVRASAAQDANSCRGKNSGVFQS